MCGVRGQKEMHLKKSTKIKLLAVDAKVSKIYKKSIFALKKF